MFDDCETKPIKCIEELMEDLYLQTLPYED
jgi:hypothetical protein